MIDKMVEHARAFVAKSGKSLEVDAAREGAEIFARRQSAGIIKRSRGAATLLDLQSNRAPLVFSARCLVV